MRGVITAICVAAVVVGSTVWYAHATSEISADLSDINKTVEQSLSNDDFAAAKQSIDNLTRRIDEKRALLAITGNHEQLDKIETSISELSGYVEGGLKTEARIVCRTLAAMLEQIPRDYKLTLENIL